ncbi:MAG TPA: sigma-54 dependent transcriptional regulator [Vicinamibacterales bacterium]|nr:sigma-54 dependent transcriptional regulator [Vicinamibacterales bacterium]
MPVATRILIVEDHADSAEFLRLLLEPEGYLVQVAASGLEARAYVTASKPDIVLMDLMLPDVEGLDLLRELRTLNPDTCIIVVSGHGSIAVAVEAMENGALSFIEKPLNPSVLMAQLHKAAEKLALTSENRRLRAELDETSTYAGVIGKSKPMRQLYQLIKSVAPTDANVLITGENGTGKEVIATAIHESSKRAAGPFIKVNCAAIPTELIESELFGHKRGAFTGAVNDKQGLMELANNGTLLLDEIGDLTPNLQVKLLRVLQDREFRPVGSTKILKPNFRLISATNVDVDAALKEGRLREDLYFRINTLMLPVPALRDRSTDIPLLAEYFLRKFATQHGKSVMSFHPDAIRTMVEFAWPGNVRELQHVVERAVILTEGSLIGVDDLPDSISAAISAKQS